MRDPARNSPTKKAFFIVYFLPVIIKLVHQPKINMLDRACLVNNASRALFATKDVEMNRTIIIPRVFFLVIRKVTI